MAQMKPATILQSQDSSCSLAGKSLNDDSEADIAIGNYDESDMVLLLHQRNLGQL